MSTTTLKGDETEPGPLTSGEYFVTQTWSQETDFDRPYHVRLPQVGNRAKQLPIFIFLHGNGGNARDAMRGFTRKRNQIASRYIMVFPQGYRESWNIISERSKANDLRFIEAIISTLSEHENVQPNNVTVMGASNGAALVNQLAIESRMEQIKNYISGVSQLNVWQHDGRSFKAKGDGNQYRELAEPAKGKRFLNISGVQDRLVPYNGGPSPAIPAKNGKLAFLAAETSTYLWARHMGYRGKKLQKPSNVFGGVEAFSYLKGDVVHLKMLNQGHGATHQVDQQILLKFLEGNDFSR